MQWSLFLLILMGQCSLFVCHPYKYHFIQEKKTWDEAQRYCREHYTDLAKVFNMRDARLLNKSDAWIGLSNSTDGIRTWHWSLPGVEYNKSEGDWASEEPNNIKAPENCVRIDPLWKDVPCDENYAFICYDSKQDNFRKIDQKMTWPEAQNYCRENHTDLVSGLEQLKDAGKNGKKYLWIGLFADTWRWSDGSHFSFRNWDLKIFKDEVNKPCAMTVSNGKWSSDDCNKSKYFFCYDDKVILIKKRKTWEEALYFCRDNYHDLVSITNLDEQRWVQEKAKMADTPHVWLGLRYTCALDFWFWISDEAVEYKNWDSPGETDECDMSGAMDSKGQHKWFKKIDNEEFNFICSMC